MAAKRDDGSVAVAGLPRATDVSSPPSEAAQPPVDPFAAIRAEQEAGLRVLVAAEDAWRLEVSLANLAALEAARRR